ncbi:MAG: hypothetical protein AB9842_11745 [Bacteroidales bacterium]
MRFRFAVLLLSVFALFSCNKEDDDNTVLIPENFQPVSAYSSWTYSEYPGTGLYTVTMTGMDTTFNKKKYKQMFNNLGGFSYFRKENGSYYLLYPADTTREFLYLKDKALVNDTWEMAYEVNGFPTRLVYKTLSMNKPALVGGIMYDHVIVVKTDTYIDFGMGDSLVSSQNSSYANDVGLILADDGQKMTYLNHYIIR